MSTYSLKSPPASTEKSPKLDAAEVVPLPEHVTNGNINEREARELAKIPAADRARRFVQQCQLALLAVVHELRRNRARKARR